MQDTAEVQSSLESTSPQLRRASRARLYWVLAGLLFLIGLLAAWQLPVFDTGLESDQAVLANSHRLSDGRLDYLALLNRQLSEGVTPENNAVTLLSELISDDEYLTAGFDKDEFFAALGRPAPDATRRTFITSDQLQIQRGIEVGSEASNQLYDQFKIVETTPWLSSDFPFWADWLQVNAEVSERLHQASQRQKYFQPLTAVKPDVANQNLPPVLSVTMPICYSLRDQSQFLAVRAMYHIGNRDADAAIRDLQTLRRLARLQAQSLSLNEALTAVKIDQLANLGEAELLNSQLLDGPRVLEYLKFLQDHPLHLDMGTRIGVFEKYMYLDAVQFVRLYGSEKIARSGSSQSGGSRPLVSSFIDWSVTLEYASFYTEVQQLYPQIKNGFRKQPFPGLSNPLWRVESLESDSATLLSESRWLWGAKHRGRLMGRLVFGLLIPTVNLLAEADIRCQTQRELTQLAFAITAYRFQEGRLPRSLEDLAPEWITEVPPDRFAVGALVYRPSETGFRVYSIGINGVDDGGESFILGTLSNPQADDWAVEMKWQQNETSPGVQGEVQRASDELKEH
ncbi:MAG: hypothetical protein Q8M16_01915 [Pirellulaceae bacterium]|nr:hypothetical protein [Pirellulaceae bacterium]